MLWDLIRHILLLWFFVILAFILFNINWILGAMFVAVVIGSLTEKDNQHNTR